MSQIRHTFQMYLMPILLGLMSLALIALVYLFGWRIIVAVGLIGLITVSVLVAASSLFFASKEQDKEHRKIQLSFALGATLMAILAFALIPDLSPQESLADGQDEELEKYPDGKDDEKLAAKTANSTEPAKPAEPEPADPKVTASPRSEPLLEPWLILKAANGKWGFIDVNGEVKIEPQFDWAISFNRSALAPVEVDDKWGYIDRTGSFVVEPKYDYVGEFSDGRARVTFDSFTGTDGFIDEKGEVIIPLEYDADDFKEGMSRIEADGKVGYIDRDGNVVVEPTYQWGSDFSDDVAIVRNKVGEKLEYGVIDRKGELIIPFSLSRISEFSEGLAGIRKGEKEGFIDKRGEMVIPAKFDYVREFSDGVAAVRVGDWDTGRYGYINRSGTFVIEPTLHDAWEFVDGVAIVEGDDTWGLIDKSGDLLVKLQPLRFQQNEYGLVLLSEPNGDMWAYMNHKGQPIGTSLAGFDTGKSAMQILYRRYDKASKKSQDGIAVDALLSIWTNYADSVPQEARKPLRGLLYNSMAQALQRNFGGVNNPDARLVRVWSDRVERLPFPTSEVESTSRMSFGVSQVFIAVTCKERGEWTEAQYRYLLAKTAIDKAMEENSAYRRDREAQAWYRQIETLGREISTRGHVIGSYVTNKSFTQKWIGIITGVDGRTATVRMTWVGKSTEFKKGNPYPILLDQECKPLERLSLAAILEGWRE